jgi:hypothetical protein
MCHVYLRVSCASGSEDCRPIFTKSDKITLKIKYRSRVIPDIRELQLLVILTLISEYMPSPDESIRHEYDKTLYVMSCHKELHLLEYSDVWSGENQPASRRNISTPSSGSKVIQARNHHEAGSTQLLFFNLLLVALLASWWFLA